jgi:hypothetical protein
MVVAPEGTSTMVANATPSRGALAKRCSAKENNVSTTTAGIAGS